MTRIIEITTEEVSQRASAIGRETMSGDLRDAIIDILKTRIPASWQSLAENEQRDLAAVIEQLCEGIAERAVSILASDGREVITARVKAITKVTDEIVVQLVAPKIETTLIKLASAIGKTVSIVTADADQYIGERGAPDIDEDAPDLPIEIEGQATVEDDPPAAEFVTADETPEPAKRTRATKIALERAAEAGRASAALGEQPYEVYDENLKLQGAFQSGFDAAMNEDRAVDPPADTGTAEVDDAPAATAEVDDGAPLSDMAGPTPPGPADADDGRFPSPFGT